MVRILQHADWLNGGVPDTVRVRVRQMVEVVGYLPYPQPLGVITGDGVVLAANQPLLDLIGARDHEPLEADWDDFMPGWTARVTERVAGAGTASGPSYALAFEDYLMPLGAEPVWVKAVACPVSAPVGDRSGEVNRVESGRAGADAPGEAVPDAAYDEALAAWLVFILNRPPGARERDDHHRRMILDLLLESPSEFVVQVGVDGELQYVSPSLRRALGSLAAGAEGKPFTCLEPLTGEAFRTRFSHLMADLQRSPYSGELEMNMTTSAGRRIVNWRFESLLADGGVAGAMLGVGHDVTERRQAEERLAESELRLRTLVEATHQLVWTTGPGGIIDGPMESWSAFTGQTGEEVLGDGWAEAIHPDDRDRVLTAWRTAVAARVVHTYEYRLRDRDGRYRWIETRAVPLEGDGEPRYIAAGHDITERKEAEEEVRRRVRELEEAMERTVVALSGAASARDPYTVGHERRVGELSMAIGEQLGMPADELRLLRLAATVHDLGKIAIPAEILSKPIGLSEAEYAIIRAHARIGWEMLLPAGLPESVTDAVLQHHERLDGSGYPNGLRGEEIGRFARILAVADVVMAMSTHRPYRPVVGIDAALEEIERGRGTQYDPAAADACLRLFKEDGFAFSG